MAQTTRRGAPTPLDASAPSASELTAWGLDPAWSRLVTFPGATGVDVTWHVLDTGPGAEGTIVCVHGNPTWGYLWRDVLRTLGERWRVIAVDQTGMGYSERPGPRRLAERVEELVAFCRQEVGGPVVFAAHDWGGAIATGATASLETRGLILTNTAVAKPADVGVPPLIGAARRLVDLTCRRTPLFVDGTAAMTEKIHRPALRAPYRSASRRAAVADFVADIPVTPTDPSFSALAQSAAAFEALTCPVLLLWGGKDPVFHDRFLRDLRRRAPQAHVQRFAHAGHLVPLDAPIGPLVARWLDDVLGTPPPAPLDPPAPKAEAGPLPSLLSELEARSSDRSLAYQGPDGAISWASLGERSRIAAAGLRRLGVEPGDRVAVIIPPSIELLIAVAAIWRIGAVLVVADASAGLPQLRRLLRGAAPRFLVGTPTTIGVARLGRFAPGAKAACFASLPGAADLRDGAPENFGEPADLAADDLAALVHTSGATGPAKAVRYTHGALLAQREALKGILNGTPGDAFTTSFGPFMLLAPVLGMGCVRPDFDVNHPVELDFDAFQAATALAKVTTAWLSPASAKTIASTAAGRHAPIDLVLLAGAPIPTVLVEEIHDITLGEVRAPYGMTECLPVTDGIDPTLSGPLGGTATGRPLPGCEILIVPLDDVEGPSLDEGSWGEILVRAPWMFDGYDGAWSLDRDSSVERGTGRFHRTGDVGYLSGSVLFQLGRAVHVIRTAHGPVASISVEEPIAGTLRRSVAAVGVGPSGASVLAVVIEDDSSLALAPASLAAQARGASGLPLAAVLTGRLPTDRRHESKVDRSTLASSVGAFLAGR